MTIEAETRFLGIPIRRTPVKTGSVVTGAWATLPIATVEVGIYWQKPITIEVISPDSLSVTAHLGVDRAEPKKTLEAVYVLDRDKINVAGHDGEIPGIRFPGVKTYLKWSTSPRS